MKRTSEIAVLHSYERVVLNNKMLRFHQSSHFCSVCVVLPDINHWFLFISAWQRWRSWNSSSIQLNLPNWQVTIIAQIFFIINDISNQITKLDTSCSIRTKDEHADCCHMIMMSNVILLLKEHRCLSKKIDFVSFRVWYWRLSLWVYETYKKAEDLLIPTQFFWFLDKTICIDRLSLGNVIQWIINFIVYCIYITFYSGFAVYSTFRFSRTN